MISVEEAIKELKLDYDDCIGLANLGNKKEWLNQRNGWYFCTIRCIYVFKKDCKKNKCCKYYSINEKLMDDLDKS